MEQYISSIDTARFGFAVARIREAGEDLEGLVARLTAAGVELVIARIQASDIAGMNRLEKLGFRIKDIQLTHRYDLARFDPAMMRPSSVTVRDVEQADVDQVVALAAQSFAGYGHYAADDRLDQGQCRDAYVDWTRRSCEDGSVADKVIVAVKGGTVHGFLTFKIFELDGQKYAAGGLGAVGPEHRGGGAFSAIVLRGLEWGVSLGLAWEEHNALVTNDSVNRVFARLGFRSGNAMVTLHGWLQPARG